jgi:hypothetical protein
MTLPRALAVAAFAVLASTAGCAGPPFAAPIEGEPVCADFTVGAGKTPMRGALQFPVELRILDGKAQMQRVVISGKHPDDEKPSHTYLPDDNATYTVEWAQCSNEWAPKSPTHHAPLPKGAPRPKEDGAYECGEAKPYKTDKIVTKKHDPRSHVLAFVAPPKPGCWVSDVVAPPPPPPPASATPSAEPAASAAPSAEPPASAAPPPSAKP